MRIKKTEYAKCKISIVINSIVFQNQYALAIFSIKSVST